MRFRSEFIGPMRRGQMVTTRRPAGTEPPRWHVGQYRVIERTYEERVESDSKVTYEPRCQTLEGEYVHIEGIKRACVEALSPVEALGEGMPTVEAFMELWEALYGRRVGPCWVVSFRYTTDVPNFLARQHGLLDPPQYVQSQGRAIDDAEAPTSAEIEALNLRLERRQIRDDKKEAQARLAACRTPEARTTVLYELANAYGIDVRSDQRAMERRVLDRIGKSPQRS